MKNGQLNYDEFLRRKSQFGENSGFEPIWIPEFLFDFQRSLVEWAIRKGRAAIFADCGLGKTPMQLMWAENVVRKTNKPVLILTPLAVSHQTIREAEKFGIEAHISRDGEVMSNITVTNYERLHYFKSEDFAAVVCDDASIMKNFAGKRKAEITEFMRTRPYRLLCTATAAPNDYYEFGTSSEALGWLGFQDMITKFFRQDTTKDYLGWGRTKYILREHARKPFWQWMCSWVRTIRKPSDYGYDNGDFVLPELRVRQTVVECSRPRTGTFFPSPAVTLQEQREERRSTLRERCEKVAEIVSGRKTSVAWCHLNDEGDLLEKLIDDCVQISGKDSDDAKEEKLLAFTTGQVKKLISKAKITGFGLNWQHCSHTTMFPSHSFEQYYQSVRRFLRFGQKEIVHVDIVTTPGEERVIENFSRKSKQADVMFEELITNMNNALKSGVDEYSRRVTVPTWL